MREADALLGRVLLRAGAIAMPDLVACVEAQRAAGADAPNLATLLRRRKAVDPLELERALIRVAKRTQPKRVARRKRPRTSPEAVTGWRTAEEDGALPGERLGDYQVEGLIARGSMGAVFRARDVRKGRVVALKVLAGERARHPAGPARFEREALLLCSLRHPGLVSGHGFGAQGQRRFLAMEFVDGPSLKKRVETKGALSEAEVARIGVELARALDYLHRRGIVHRDVKPANVLLCPEGGARLCDLGLARETTSEMTGRFGRGGLPTHAGATATGDTLGTPSYMAPEQAQEAREASPASDLYSLGVTLFHALAGRPPFLSESGIVVLTRHVVDGVPDVRSLRPGVSPQLAAVIRRLTRKDPSQRFASAAEVARVLEALGGAAPVRLAA